MSTLLAPCTALRVQTWNVHFYVRATDAAQVTPDNVTTVTILKHLLKAIVRDMICYYMRIPIQCPPKLAFPRPVSVIVKQNGTASSPFCSIYGVVPLILPAA
jgi:hypothetical protein